MKKLFLLIVTILSFNSYATQTVPILWAFSPASNQANALRVIIDVANKSQTKYNFVFENKTGAGGSIAVNHMINSSQPTLLMISTSIFVRPKYYPEQSYDLNKIQPIAITATDSPLSILAKDSNSLEELNKKSVIKVGIVQGSITESLARTVFANSKSEIIYVPYPGSINATNDLMGDHIDASVEFIKDSIPWVESNKAKIIGISGTNSINSFKTFSAQGVKNSENVISNYYMLTSANANSEFVQEMHNIITNAMTNEKVIDVWKYDYANVQKRSYADTIDFWNKQKIYWSK